MVAKRFAKTIYCYNNIDGRRCIAPGMEQGSREFRSGSRDSRNNQTL